MGTADASKSFIAYAKQAAFGTAITDVTAFKYFPPKAGGIKDNRPSKASDQLRGMDPRWMRAQNSMGEGGLPMDCYYRGLGLLLDSAFKRTTTAVASYVIDATNNKINFKESSGGSELTATLANATYTATNLATEIKTAMEAAAGSADTYTVTYSESTGKFTIAPNGTYLSLLFATGTNAAASIRTIAGFGASDIVDSSAPISITAGTEVRDVKSHVFTLDDTGAFTAAQLFGTTILDHRDIDTLQGDSMFMTSLALAWGEGDPHAPLITPNFTGRMVQPVAAVTPPAGTLNDEPGTPEGNVDLDITLNGNPFPNHYFQSFNANIVIPVAMKHSIGSTRAVKAVRPGKASCTIQYQWLYEDDDTLPSDLQEVWADFDETGSLTITQQGLLIRGTAYQSLALTLPALRPIGESPPNAAGSILQSYSYQAEHDTTNDAAMLTLTLINDEAVS